MNRQYAQLIEMKFRESLEEGEYNELLQLKRMMMDKVKQILRIGGAHLNK